MLTNSEKENDGQLQSDMISGRTESYRGINEAGFNAFPGNRINDQNTVVRPDQRSTNTHNPPLTQAENVGEKAV